MDIPFHSTFMPHVCHVSLAWKRALCPADGHSIPQHIHATCVPCQFGLEESTVPCGWTFHSTAHSCHMCAMSVWLGREHGALQMDIPFHSTFMPHVCHVSLAWKRARCPADGHSIPQR